MGHKLRSVREAKGLSQEELAKKADVSRTTIWSLETNPNAQTTTKTLQKIADALETTVADIFFANDVQ
jgi:DNA-binding XRE family transcriptional regulator